MKSKTIVFIPYKLHIRHLLNAVAARVKLIVLLPPEKSLPEDSKIEGIRISYAQFGADKLKQLIGKEIRTQKYIRGLSRILKGVDIDTLITCEFYHWYTLQCIAFKKSRKNIKLFIISETKQWPKNKVAHVMKWLVLQYVKLNKKHINGIFVYTSAAKDFIQAHMLNTRIELLPTPVDTSLFKPKDEKEFLTNGKLRLLMNARFSPYKRHKDLFASIAILREEGHKLQVTCVSRYEADQEDIAKLAKEMGVAECVLTIGTVAQEDIPALNYEHDVLVLPSYNEAIGMVVPEAMACGIPTITSDTVGGNVYVEENETGFIYPTGDVEALTKSIRKCFDAALLSKMGVRANKRIVEHFTPEIVADGFMESIKATALE